MIIGYVFTIVYLVLFLGLIISAFLSRDRIARVLHGKVDRKSLLAASIIIIFFVAFALKFVHPVEQLYFDENIYQGIALNILHNGNALWCQYGTAGLNVPCTDNLIYHDPVELSFYIAIAFAIFGISVSTAFGLELAIGAISIFLVFLLASSLFGKKTGVASAIVFALLPELFIWSTTSAVPNLYLMMFSILVFFAYNVYRGERSYKTLAFLLSSLGIASYTRIEAPFLILIVIIIALAEFVEVRSPKRSIVSLLDLNDLRSQLIIIAFILIMIPQIYYIAYEAKGLDYGSGTICGISNTTTFSISNLQCNLGQNVNYFLGSYNSVGYYPAYFSIITTIIAVIGFLLMAFFSGDKRAKYAALMLGLWVLVFHLFYDFFYAGSVTYGVDVRFMLIIYPAIAIFAGFGISRISELVPRLSNLLKKRKNTTKAGYISMLMYTLLVAAFSIYPFINALSTTTIPYSQMPQESTPLAAVNFIYHNYTRIPGNCLIFTFTPDLWYVQNRSASQVGFFNSHDKNFTSFESKFSCFAFDWGYWCNTPGFKDSVCGGDIGLFNNTQVASVPSPSSGNFSLYTLNNYKP